MVGLVSTVTGRPAATLACTHAAPSGSTETSRRGRRAAAVVGEGRLEKRADPGRHQHQVGVVAAELVVEFVEEGGVAVDDPAGHVLVSRPRGVLHEDAANPRRVLGRGAHRVVVVRRHARDLCAFVADGLHGGRVHALGDEHPYAVAEQPGEAGDGAAVVAVRGRDDRGRPRFPAQHLLQCPRRAQRLERGQAEPVGLVLRQHPADAELAGERRELHQRGRRVVGQAAVEGQHLGRDGRAGPPRIAAGVGQPGLGAADGHRRLSAGEGGADVGEEGDAGVETSSVKRRSSASLCPAVRLRRWWSTARDVPRITDRVYHAGSTSRGTGFPAQAAASEQVAAPVSGGGRGSAEPPRPRRGQRPLRRGRRSSLKGATPRPRSEPGRLGSCTSQ